MIVWDGEFLVALALWLAFMAFFWVYVLVLDWRSRRHK